MDKPLSLKIEELRNDIITSITNAGLPIYLVEPVLKDIYTEIAVLSNKTIEKERQEYMENLVEENTEETDSSTKDE